jgi:CDP-diacylglycerol--glycerol-3-phosphate 3-phosphatidyltransferase
MSQSPRTTAVKHVYRNAADWARVNAKFILDPIARVFIRLGIRANILTFAGLLGNAAGAFFLARGELLGGGLLILAMGPIDALDGATARLRGQTSDWGAYVDSTTDRWSEGVILLGLLAYYMDRADTQGAMLVLLALFGSMMVSYTKARAEGLGFTADVGVMTRFERYLVLVPSLLLGWPAIGLWVIASLANITAVQRFLHVRKQWYARSSKPPL